MKHSKVTIIKVGDLVKIRKWCDNAGAMAIVTRVTKYGDIFVHYMTPGCLPGERYVRNSNILLISEAK